MADRFDSVHEQVAEPEWRPGTLALCEARRMDPFEDGSGGVQRRTALDRSLCERVRGSRWARATTSEEVYGMLRLDEGLSESWYEERAPAQIGLFLGMVCARRWLGLPPEHPTE